MINANNIFSYQRYEQNQAHYKQYRKFCKEHIEAFYKNMVISDVEQSLTASVNFWYFSYLVNQEINPHVDMFEPFTFVLCNAVQNLHSENQQNLPNGISCRDVIIANLSARLGKTRTLTIDHVAWLMGIASQEAVQGPNGYKIQRKKQPYHVAIRTASQNTLKVMRSEIGRILNSVAFRKLFPFCNITTENENKVGANKNTITIHFLTSGTNMTGSGFSLIINDDVLNPFTLHTKIHEKAIENTDLIVGRRTTTPMTKYLFVEQRLDYNDITNWAMKKFVLNGFPTYERIVMPFAYEKRTEYSIDLKYLPPLPKNKGNYTFADVLKKFQILEDNKIVFEAGEFVTPRFNWQTYLFLKSGVYWNTHYQNNDINEPSGAIFTNEHLAMAKNHSLHKKSLAEIIDSMKKIVIGVDLAFTDKKETSDRTAFGVVGLDYMTLKEQMIVKGQVEEAQKIKDYENFLIRRYTVIECVAGFWDLDGVLDQLVNLYLKYQSKLVRIQVEKNHGQELLSTSVFIRNFQQEMLKRGHKITHDLEELVGGKYTAYSKETRLTALSCLYLNGQVRHVVATNESGIHKNKINSIDDVMDEKNADVPEEKGAGLSFALEFEMLHKDRKLEIEEEEPIQENRLAELEKDAVDFIPGSRKKSPDLVDSIEFPINYLEREEIELEELDSEQAKIHQQFLNAQLW